MCLKFNELINGQKIQILNKMIRCSILESGNIVWGNSKFSRVNIYAARIQLFENSLQN